MIDLCDEILGQVAIRQARFEFLRGDSGRTGRRVYLPVDAFYPELNLVVEYREAQHTMAVAHFDKPDRKTIGGVHRGEQRRIYDERRRQVLPQHGIVLVEIDCMDLAHDGRFRLSRDKERDRPVVEALLANYRRKIGER